MDGSHSRHCGDAWVKRLRSALLVAMMLSAGAAISRPASAATMQQLIEGAALTLGDVQFRDWELISLDATSPVPTNLSQIVVLPLVDDPARPALQFFGNGQLTAEDEESLDLTFRFRVRMLSGAQRLTNHELAITNINFANEGGLALISNELRGGSGAELDPTLVIADNDDAPTPSIDASDFTPQAELTVVTNIFLNGLAAGSAVNLAAFTQRFAQTGPPLTAGDFDADGDVDGQDFLRWQRGESPTPRSPADLADWRANFGTRPPAVTAATPLPEPSTAGLLLIAAIVARAARIDAFTNLGRAAARG